MPLFLFLLLAWWCQPTDKPVPHATPVVVELFTSEGCSDCPAADQLLRKLEAEQPLAGVEIIPLGFHVDYWNDLGWRDRFSMHDFTVRQEMYVERMRLESPYTPQMVIDGKLQAVGNDVVAVRRALLDRVSVAKATVAAKTVSLGVLDVSVQGAPNNADLMIAITEGGLSTNVPAGENRGRELHHTAVVRALSRLGSIHDHAFAGQVHVPLNKAWRSENLHAVVFVQASSGEIVGASTVSLAEWRF